MARTDEAPDKADRRAARELVVAYHHSQLRELLEHVRVGFSRLDAGDIDEFELAASRRVVDFEVILGVSRLV
jgi:hypothetical protein